MKHEYCSCTMLHVHMQVYLCLTDTCRLALSMVVNLHNGWDCSGDMCNSKAQAMTDRLFLDGVGSLFAEHVAARRTATRRR